MAFKISQAERIYRFWSRVRMTGKDDCWLWTGAKTGNGYGAMWLEGRNIGAHCFAWIITRGKIPEGLWVLHRCDTPLCVNQEHLFLGTCADNIKDRDRKGRGHSGMRVHPELAAKGERNGGHKLITSEVLAIRLSAKTAIELARQYNVTKSTIYRIKWRQTWKHHALPTELSM